MCHFCKNASICGHLNFYDCKVLTTWRKVTKTQYQHQAVLESQISPKAAFGNCQMNAKCSPDSQYLECLVKSNSGPQCNLFKELLGKLGCLGLDKTDKIQFLLAKREVYCRFCYRVSRPSTEMSFEQVNKMPKPQYQLSIQLTLSIQFMAALSQTHTCIHSPLNSRPIQANTQH